MSQSGLLIYGNNGLVASKYLVLFPDMTINFSHNLTTRKSYIYILNYLINVLLLPMETLRKESCITLYLQSTVVEGIQVW